jgi:predicted nuclease with RNAse H fold
MNGSSPQLSFWVGWDVGGWNCDRNANSRDAIVILDEALRVVGKPWRGNLRGTINAAKDAEDFLGRLFALCGASASDSPGRVTLAIDTPLGFSEAFQRLATGLTAAGQIESSAANPYLFRQTERYLFRRGLTPLSAVKDMIGSQATKGMHVLARFAPLNTACGVWSSGDVLTVIEAYPASCRRSEFIRGMKLPFEAGFEGRHEDERDALTCALIAALHGTCADALIPPPPEVPASEGWIWLPKDALGDAA